jgi:hypothetical protein
MDHFRLLKTDPELPERLDVLLDLADVTSVPEREQLREVAAAIEELKSTVEWGACAVVARQDVLFGMSRMFETFADGSFARTHVFRERHEAERWLSTDAREQRDHEHQNGQFLWS